MDDAHLTTAATALVVIDLQRGAFDGARCPPIDGADALGPVNAMGGLA